MPLIVKFANKTPVFNTKILKENCVGCTLLDMSKNIKSLAKYLILLILLCQKRNESSKKASPRSTVF